MKKLTTEILSLYFPHQLRCMVDGNVSILQGIYSDGSCVFYDLVESEWGFKSIKPILEPMTSTILHRIWNDEITPAQIPSPMSDEFIRSRGFDGLYDLLAHNPDQWPSATLNLFARHHLDIFELIPKGLAIDARTLSTVNYPPSTKQQS